MYAMSSGSYGTKSRLLSRLSPAEIRWIADQLRKAVECAPIRRKIRVFLCGGSLADASSARAKLQGYFTSLEQSYLYDLHLPEVEFGDLFLRTGRADLLSVENNLAQSVDVVVLVPESAGSIAELGGFTNHDELRKKLLVVIDEKYKQQKSFIMGGPIRLLRRKREGKVLFARLDELGKVALEKIGKATIDFAPRTHESKIDIANTFDAEHFVLTSLYVLEPLVRDELHLLLQKAVEVDDLRAEMCIFAGIRRLLTKGSIRSEVEGFRYSAQRNNTISPIQYLHSDYDISRLDAIRVEVLTALHRRKRILLETEDGLAS